MASGESKWITGPAAREDVHRLRARSSAVMTGIGQSLQFEAVAFDASGAVVDTTFTWTTSDAAVLSVDAQGLAIARAVGSAQVTASVGGVSDAATIAVDQLEAARNTWQGAVSGDWSDPGKWSTGAVPGPDEIAVILAFADAGRPFPRCGSGPV